MNRSLIIISVIILLFGTQAVFAQVAPTNADIPTSIRNNKYFIESVRLATLAQQAFDDGDYDASTQYSQEAVRNASLSDDFVRLQLKIRETDDAIAAARKRLDYATSVNAASRYPAEYNLSQTAYTEARGFRAAENWDDAIASANKVLSILASISGERAKEATPAGPTGPTPLPAQYTVRLWSTFKDCFWNIAGRPWVYDDPYQWRRLYNANKSKIPDANNPNVIEPGMVLDIPSIKGETRQGMWDANKTYPSVK